MLNNIITYLTDRLKNDGLFSSVSGIVDIVSETRTDTGETKMFPAIYAGNDSLRFVSAFDFREGCVFFVRGRQNSQQSESKRACSPLIKTEYRLSMYVIAGRKKASLVDAMTQRLSNLINIDNTTAAREAVGVNTVRVITASWETDPETAMRDVFKNVDLKFRHDLMFLKAELSATVQYYVKCQIPECP